MERCQSFVLMTGRAHTHSRKQHTHAHTRAHNTHTIHKRIHNTHHTHTKHTTLNQTPHHTTHNTHTHHTHHTTHTPHTPHHTTHTTHTHTQHMQVCYLILTDTTPRNFVQSNVSKFHTCVFTSLSGTLSQEIHGLAEVTSRNGIYYTDATCVLCISRLQLDVWCEKCMNNRVRKRQRIIYWPPWFPRIKY
jgi:hypothetical protein